ncbi:flagellar biosynthetic protein FliR [Parvularcula oceani]|uniref:flagellar biosynthetic protein FliR n=1 Tax=Parvularcula oceani TaxID=1247963 RepID=UPI000563014E|nr:flagellar biosynthetic protein FliR [Parvularcula oceani]
MTPEFLAALVTVVVAVGLRLSLMVFLLPGIGERAVPVRVRLGIVLALLGALVPFALADAPPVTDVPLLPLMLSEALIGFGLGFSLRVMIYALTIAGTVIAQVMSLSQILGAALTDEGNPSVSLLLTMAGAALFVTLDLHAVVVGLVAESYEVFPLADFPATGALAEWATARSAAAFTLAVSLALPFVLIGFIYNVVLGLINQAMPQMMVTFVGVPANVLAGLFLLAASLGVILVAWTGALDAAQLRFW